VVPHSDLEISTETPYIELADFELNPGAPESKAAPEPGDPPVEIVPPPVYASTIHVYSQGRITQLLADAHPEEPRAPQNDARCTSHNMENMLRGASGGGGIGLIMHAMCGTSLLTATGCAVLGAMSLFCCNPPLLSDYLYPDATPQTTPRR
jgi:hypothetical protein